MLVEKNGDILNPMRPDPVIIVHKTDDFVPRFREAPEPRITDAESRFLHDAEGRGRILRPAARGGFGGAVRRGIVDHHDLPTKTFRNVLRRQMPKSFWKPLRAVMAANNYGHSAVHADTLENDFPFTCFTTA
jgi:hypothetical protein